MDQLSLLMGGLILALTALQLYRRSKVLIKAKNTVVEKTSLGISVGMIALVTIFGSSQPLHYVVGALLALLVAASVAKTGITADGLNSMNRIFFTLPWKSLRFAKLIRRTNGQEFVLHTVGRLWTNVMAFDMKDFAAVEALLKKHLRPDQYEVAEEQLVEGLRDAQRRSKGKTKP